MKRESCLRLALSLAVVAAGLGVARAQHYADQLAASVNGEVITISEVEQVIRQRLADGHTPPERFEELRQEVLGMLIDDSLVRQYLSKNGPRVPDGEIQRWLSQLEGKLKSDGKTLGDYYRELGSSENDVKKSVTHMLQWVRFVNDSLDDAALQRYYEDHRDFFDQVTVRASHIVIRMSAANSELRAEGRARLAEMRQDLIAGKIDFAEAAKKYSQCPSADKGGDIGYFPRRFAVDEEIARAAFVLKPGEISDVVATEHGLHLILVTDRKEGKKTDFKMVKATVREVAAGEMMQQLVSKERQTAQIKVFLGEAAAPARHASFEQPAPAPPHNDYAPPAQPYRLQDAPPPHPEHVTPPAATNDPRSQYQEPLTPPALPREEATMQSAVPSQTLQHAPTVVPPGPEPMTPPPSSTHGEITPAQAVAPIERTYPPSGQPQATPPALPEHAPPAPMMPLAPQTPAPQEPAPLPRIRVLPMPIQSENQPSVSENPPAPINQASWTGDAPRPNAATPRSWPPTFAAPLPQVSTQVQPAPTAGDGMARPEAAPPSAQPTIVIHIDGNPKPEEKQPAQDAPVQE